MVRRLLQSFCRKASRRQRNFKYGPTPDNSEAHWYEYLYDGETGAEINGNVVTLHLVDGKRGDSDLVVNGAIVDPERLRRRPTFPVPAAVEAGAASSDNQEARHRRERGRFSLR